MIMVFLFYFGLFLGNLEISVIFGALYGIMFLREFKASLSSFSIDLNTDKSPMTT